MSTALAPRDVANAYFRHVEAGEVDSVVALFAQDAEMIPAARPAAGSLRGRAAIAAHYRSVLDKPVRFLNLRRHDAGASCVVEIEAEVGEERRRTEVVDIFTLDADGLIERMSVYRR